MASGAGLNKFSATILTLNNNGAAVIADPNAAYGTIGVNDSGPVAFEAQDFTKLNFSLTGDGSGYTVVLLGSNDPSVTGYMLGQLNGVGSWETKQKGWPTTLPTGIWVKVAGPSEQASGGSSSNPLTGATPGFTGNGPYKVLRAVLIGNDGTSAATAYVNLEAVP